MRDLLPAHHTTCIDTCTHPCGGVVGTGLPRAGKPIDNVSLYTMGGTSSLSWAKNFFLELPQRRNEAERWEKACQPQTKP